MLLIPSKGLISFFRYSNFCIYFFISFSPCQPMLDKMIEKIDVIICLNRNLKTHIA